MDLAKIEIDPKYINGATIELEYTITIENLGNISGYAEQIVDYVEKYLEFSEDKNESWFLATDGNIYTKKFNEMILNPGEKQEIKLVLTKTMNEKNTGFIINKIRLLDTFVQTNIKEKSEGNTSVQNTFITASTGRNYVKPILLIAFIIAGFVYLFKRGIISRSRKKVYKENQKLKSKIKKVYK